MTPSDLKQYETLQYQRAAIRVAAAALSPDAQQAFVASFDRLTSYDVQQWLTESAPSEKEIRRAAGNPLRMAKDFIMDALGVSPTPEKVEELAEYYAGRQLSSAELEVIRNALTSQGSSATGPWFLSLLMKIGSGALNALPAGQTPVP